jgi:four helix bundle protein
MKIESYRDLKVWQAGRALVKQVYLLTKEMPPEEKYGLTSQMRRAAVSIPSNIAEGWARHYPAEFIQFLRTANGSLAELETQLILTVDLEFLPAPTVESTLEDCHSLGRQILALERSINRRT